MDEPCLHVYQFYRKEDNLIFWECAPLNLEHKRVLQKVPWIYERNRAAKTTTSTGRIGQHSCLKESMLRERPVLTNETFTQHTVSVSKVVTILTDTPKQNYPKKISDIIELLCCPESKSSGLKLYEIFAKSKGFASKLQLKCICGFTREPL